MFIKNVSAVLSVCLLVAMFVASGVNLANASNATFGINQGLSHFTAGFAQAGASSFAMNAARSGVSSPTAGYTSYRINSITFSTHQTTSSGGGTRTDGRKPSAY